MEEKALARRRTKEVIGNETKEEVAERGDEIEETATGQDAAVGVQEDAKGAEVEAEVLAFLAIGVEGMCHQVATGIIGVAGGRIAVAGAVIGPGTENVGVDAVNATQREKRGGIVVIERVTRIVEIKIVEGAAWMLKILQTRDLKIRFTCNDFSFQLSCLIYLNAKL